MSSPADAEACGRCDGAWAVHGLAERESCNCRTRDRGRRCFDGGECEGDCLLETSASPSDAPTAVEGRCSEFVTVYGCFARLEREPQTSDGVSSADTLPVTCVD